MSFYDELKRRNVLRVALAYLAGAWLLLQVADVLIDNTSLPNWVFQTSLVILAIGFPVALILAWALEVTPAGVKLEKDVDRGHPPAGVASKKFDRIVIAVLAIAVGYFAFDKFVMVDPPADKSIAVLPFLNMSDDADNEYFAEGMSEELLNLLAKIPELRVISRSSAFSFKGQDIDIPLVAEQLNVAYILEGSVRKSGNQVRITAQLIEARSDTHLWSATYDRTLEDIFAIQDEIAVEVVDQLKVTLLGEVAKADEVDPAAYAFFLQARHILNQYDAERLPQAESLLQQALDREPDYVLALAELSRLYARQSRSGQRPDDEAEQLIRETLTRAEAIDSNNGLVQLYLGGLKWRWDDDRVAAALHFARAIELSANDAFVLQQAGSFARRIGRFDVSNALAEYLLARDPLCIDCKFRLALGYRAAGRLDDADAMLRDVLILEPDHYSVRFLLGVSHLLRGNAQAALAEFEQEKDIYRAEGEILAFHDLGRQVEYEAAFDELRKQPEIEEVIAEIYAWVGDTDGAFEWLDKMYELYEDAPVHFPFEPLLQKLHDDPRWNEFLKKIGRSPEQLAAIEFEPELPED